METIFCNKDVIYTGLWAFIGSSLGYFSFRYGIDKSPKEKIVQCLLSVALGLFIAYPLTEYLHEVGMFGKKLNMMLGGIGAFGLPDIILRHYTKITTAIAEKVVVKVSGEVIDKSTKHCGRNNDI